MTKGLSIFAAVLIVIGVAAYALSGAASVTALIPAFFGIPIGLCAAIAAAKPSAARGASIAAAVLAVLGLLGILGRLAPPLLKGELTLDLAAGTQIAMAVVCLALLVWVLVTRSHRVVTPE